MPWLLHPGLRLPASLLAAAVALASNQPGRGAPASPPPPTAAAAAASPTPALPTYYIREYRVLGVHHLTALEVETAVYPFLGPGRTAEDVDQARAALQKVYQDKSFSAVDVEIPPAQTARGGVVFLQVNELPVGRLRVHGSRYFDLERIKQRVPSLAQGQLFNYIQAQKELTGLSQIPDLRIKTPAIRAGVVPGTEDIDLNVSDVLPLHGSVDLNNRYSADTPSLRLDASLSYDNLWQLSHAIGGSFQISPQNVSKVQVFTGFYTARFPGVDWFSLTLQGTVQNSKVSTLGSIDVAGKGDIVGLRANFQLPALGSYAQSFSFGIDYKDFNQSVRLGAATTSTETPTTYVPLTFDYNGTWSGTKFLTSLDLQVVLNLRGIGSNAQEFDNNRFGADRNFIYLRGDVSHTQDLPWDMQLFGKIEGQVSDSPLINSEQFSVGGLGTVRGYLEAEALGDDAAVGNLEFRTPSLLGWMKDKGEWRFYFFTDAGIATLQDTLPEQDNRFYLASFGAGTRFQLFDHFSGSLDLAIPLTNQTTTKARNPFLIFQVGLDF